MSAIDRGIGSEGLEQGGPNLGNDYSRRDLSIGKAGDALTTPNTTGLGKEEDDNNLNVDKESSRNLSGEMLEDDDPEEDTDLEEDDIDEDDFDDLDDEDDDDDDDEDDELDKGL